MCPTLCDPMDYSLPGSSVQRILQARILEWIAIPFSRGSSWPWDWTRSPVVKADSLLSEPWGKPYNVGGPYSISWKIYRTKTGLPWERENSASQLPLDSNYNSSLSLQPASLPHQIHTHTHTHTHILLILFVWRTLTKYKYLGNFFMRMNLRTSTPWKKSYDQPRQHIKKQRHYFAKKGPSSQGYGFSSSQVWMWELDYKESRALKNLCFWTVVLEKTLEHPLDCKEIQPVHPKGNQSWIFIGRTDVEAETPIHWPPDAKNWLIWKDPNTGKDWRQKEKGMTEDEMVG